jgi:glycerol-3-phosphate dehydrogenase
MGRKVTVATRRECTQVRRQDVQSVWSGLRPLAVDPKAVSTADVVRDHLISVGSNGLVTVAGGKWTTYRLMAEETVDAAVAAGGLTVPGKCSTHNRQLLGAKGYSAAAFAHLAQVRHVRDCKLQCNVPPSLPNLSQKYPLVRKI